MNVARLRLAPVGETAGFPHEPSSLKPLVPLKPLGAAPALSVAATEAHRVSEGLK
jgi:hypothetical protein